MKNNDYFFTKLDISFLHKVYEMRCLTLHQVYNYFYKDKYSLEELLDKVLIPMQLNKVIKIVPFVGNYAILLDRAGHDYLRDNILVKEILDSDRNQIRRGYNNLGENNLETKSMNHQVHLNEFVLETEENIKKINATTAFNISYDYKDEKQVSKYFYIRPDGLLSLDIKLNNEPVRALDLFLEMDMATETAKHLTYKFKRYNDFVKSREFYSRHEKIVVLFIIANTERLNERKRLIRKAFNDNFNRYNERFDLFIGTKVECLNYLFNMCLNDKSSIEYVKDYLSAAIKSCDLNIDYINKPEYLIKLKNNKTFFFDSYLDSLGSIDSKITYYHHINNAYKLKYKNNIDYLILTKDPLETLLNLEALNIAHTERIFFTTIERLETMPIYEAIYTYGNDGSISHFVDETFTNMKFEKNIKDRK